MLLRKSITNITLPKIISGKLFSPFSNFFSRPVALLSLMYAVQGWTGAPVQSSPNSSKTASMVEAAEEEAAAAADAMEKEEEEEEEVTVVKSLPSPATSSGAARAGLSSRAFIILMQKLY